MAEQEAALILDLPAMEEHEAASIRDLPAMDEREAAHTSILDLPDDVILLVMEKVAAVSGTKAALLGLASAWGRFRVLAYGESSKLFDEPVFVGESSPEELEP
eukprot:tig00000441_g724.t1